MPTAVRTYRPSRPDLPSRHHIYDQAARDPQAKRFYDSARWRKLRLIKLKTNPLCEQCLEQGLIVVAQIVHHKIEVRAREDHQLDLDNLVSLCSSCHSALHRSRPDPRGEGN